MNEQTVPPPARPPAPPGRAPLPVRLVVLGTIVVPLLGLAAVPFFVWEWGFSWTDLGLLVGMYLLTALGVAVGFHRLITHRSFETYEWVRFALAAAGAMAVQGSMLQWVPGSDSQVIWNDREDGGERPHFVSRVLDVKTGKRHTLPAPVETISPTAGLPSPPTSRSSTPRHAFARCATRCLNYSGSQPNRSDVSPSCAP